MKVGKILHVDWNNITNYSDEDITYFLFLEGKTVECLCKIRNLAKEVVQQHILNGKIKYGILAKSKDEKDLFRTISISGKLDKIEAIKALDEENKTNLIEFIRRNYGDMKTKEKENAVWILGEIGRNEVADILIKASVHNHVNVRRMAVSAIGKIKDPSLEYILIRTLDDINPQVVGYTIKSLVKIGSKKGTDKIKKIYTNTDKEYLKKVAKEYLELVDKLPENNESK